MKITYADTGEPAKPASSEYLRRNLLHCASVGAMAGADAAIKRLSKTKRPPKWLLVMLEGVRERAGRVSVEMAKHRDEMEAK